jgi:ERI1 exoribonuclease 3
MNTFYICILDFEATCWKENGNHEIIEFPSVMLKWTTASKNLVNHEQKIIQVSEIQHYVKPYTYPVVSTFCNELTGITQEMVNYGIELRNALDLHFEWLSKFGNVNMDNLMIVTCGKWDLDIMLPMDLKKLKIVPHNVYKRFVNIKDLFMDIAKVRSRGMQGMLDYFELELLGKHHSGIDDCKNIARIFIKLVEHGLTLESFLDCKMVVDQYAKNHDNKKKK